MLNKARLLTQSKLTSQSAFQAVFRARKKHKSHYGALHFHVNNLSYPRLGLITSKRNVRLAVKRNLIRRIVREQFRLHQQSLSGYDIVFVAFKGAGEATRAELHRCLEQLLNTLSGSSRRS